MAAYLVERYLSRAEATGVDRDAANAARAARQLTREGTPVRYLSSIFVPEDETCFLLYEAASADAVCEAARRAELPFERVAEATRSPREGESHEHDV